MNDRNICKFTSRNDQGILNAKSFFFEQELPHDGEERNLPNNSLYLVVSGEGMFRCCGVNHKLSAGDVFFTFAGVSFTIEGKDGFKYYCISFSGARGDELFRRFGITSINCVFDGCDGLIPLWNDSLVRANQENIDLVSESLVLYTFSRLKGTDEPGTDMVKFVLNYLEENFTDHKLTLSHVASAAGYNPKYLSHVFKKKFDMGFSEYLRLLRIKHAVMLIENGVTSVKNVAFLSGFSDPMYFSRVFTEVIGVSPSNYKKDRIK